MSRQHIPFAVLLIGLSTTLGQAQEAGGGAYLRMDVIEVPFLAGDGGGSAVPVYDNCTSPIDGATILHGENFTAYPFATVAYGESCGEPVTVVCSDGVLSSAASEPSCTIEAPQSPPPLAEAPGSKVKTWLEATFVGFPQGFANYMSQIAIAGDADMNSGSELFTGLYRTSSSAVSSMDLRLPNPGLGTVRSAGDDYPACVEMLTLAVAYRPESMRVYASGGYNNGTQTATTDFNPSEVAIAEYCAKRPTYSAIVIGPNPN